MLPATDAAEFHEGSLREPTYYVAASTTWGTAEA